MAAVSGVINFFSGKQEGRCLSNFWEGEIHIMWEDGGVRIYDSGECAFHGEKYVRLGEKSIDNNRRMVLINYGRTFLKRGDGIVMEGNDAKKRGGKKGLALTAAECAVWSTIGRMVQLEISWWKFNNYEEVRVFLKRSGNNILVHPAMRCKQENVVNKYWEGKGVINEDGNLVILGANMLGNIWMELRSHLI